MDFIALIFSILPIIFFLIFAIIFINISRFFFSKKSRDGFFVSKVGDIIKDYGVINEDSIFGGKQKIRLLKCSKNAETFFVIETQWVSDLKLALEYNYVKISSQTAEKMIEIFSNKLS